MDQPRVIGIVAVTRGDGSMGGVGTHLLPLVKSLGSLDGPERFVFVLSRAAARNAGQFLGDNSSIIELGSPRQRLSARFLGASTRSLSRLAIKMLIESRLEVRKWAPLVGWVKSYEATVRQYGLSLLHLFVPAYVHASVPMLVNPHDLQHEHFPQFFPKEELAKRQFVYRNAITSATAIVAGSNATAKDVMSCYQVGAGRIYRIPLAPATQMAGVNTGQQAVDVQSVYDLPSQYVLYPAVTWPHKNHLRLIEALHYLRTEGMPINLVCTGSLKEPQWKIISRELQHRAMYDLVKFLGFVPTEHLRLLYRNARAVVVPTLFEQASGPVMEAWLEEVPAAASNIDSIREQAEGCALLFDPLDPIEIANSIRRIVEDEKLRKRLVLKGRERLHSNSWDLVARRYRALYRATLGSGMTPSDSRLLQSMRVQL